jgi:hypothetical protein
VAKLLELVMHVPARAVMVVVIHVLWQLDRWFVRLLLQTQQHIVRVDIVIQAKHHAQAKLIAIQVLNVIPHLLDHHIVSNVQQVVLVFQLFVRMMETAVDRLVTVPIVCPMIFVRVQQMVVHAMTQVIQVRMGKIVLAQVDFVLIMFVRMLRLTMVHVPCKVSVQVTFVPYLLV